MCIRDSNNNEAMKIYNQMVAKRLREVRNARGFLQNDLSDMLGIDRTTYLNCESGNIRYTVIT